METVTQTIPLDITSPFDQMDSAQPSPEFLKMEDFDNDTSDAGADYDTTSPCDMQATPAPVVVTSKPAKKRKSWGQQLPEPKTTLPPRKRAKTDDEKEQRRIERIKRNRAAAHNSRERKRQETEVLAVENAQLRTRLDAFEKHFGPLPKHIVLPEVTLCTDDVDTPAPSLIESRGSIGTATSPASPPDLYDLTSNDISIKLEPQDSPYSDYPHTRDNLDGKQQMPTFAPLDETQHSAEMLCDLPCPSSAQSKVAHSSSLLFSLSTSQYPIFLGILATLNLSFLTTYRTLLLAMWTTSPSRMARAITASTRASTSPSTSSFTRKVSRTPRSLSAMALAQHNAATAVARFAAIRRPLVGEARRTVNLARAGRQRRSNATMALERREKGGHQRDHDEGGVGRHDR